MQSCSSPPDLEPWQSSAEKHLFASRTSADSTQCLLPKGIHLDFSFDYSPTTTSKLMPNVMTIFCSKSTYPLLLCTQFSPSAPNIWLEPKKVHTKYSAATPCILSSLQAWEKKSDLFGFVFFIHSHGRQSELSHKAREQIFLQDANGFIPEYNFKR